MNFCVNENKKATTPLTFITLWYVERCCAESRLGPITCPMKRACSSVFPRRESRMAAKGSGNSFCSAANTMADITCWPRKALRRHEPAAYDCAM